MHLALVHTLLASKNAVTVLAGWLSGMAAGVFALQAGDTSGITPAAVTAAIVAGLFGLLFKLIDRWSEAKERRAGEEIEADGRWLGFQEMKERVATEGLQTVLTELKEVHERQVEFLQAQLLSKEIAAFRDGLIREAAFGEIGKLHTHLRELERWVSRCQNGEQGVTPPPPYEFVYQDDIVRIVEPEVDRYKRSLRRNAAAVHTSGAPDSGAGGAMHDTEG
jgi:hypothetical protein